MILSHVYIYVVIKDSEGGEGLYFWEETSEMERDVLIKVEITKQPDEDGGETFTETIIEKYLDPSTGESTLI
jgi:hypothetical protein